MTFVVRVQRPLVRAQLLQALAGVNELWSGAERLEICDEAGMLIVAAFRESFLRYRDATAAVRGVASMYGFYDAAVSVGQDGSEAAQDAVAIIFRMLTPDEMEHSGPDVREPVLRTLATRAAAIRTFIGVHSLGSPELDERLAAGLRRTETAAMAAARGDQGAFSRMMRALFTVTLTQAREHVPAREYMQRKRAEGKTWNEAMRCLKRHLAVVVYRAMLKDRPEETLTT